MFVAKLVKSSFKLCLHRIQDFLQNAYSQQQPEPSSVRELGYVFLVFLGISLERCFQDVYGPYHNISSDQSQSSKGASGTSRKTDQHQRMEKNEYKLLVYQY